jgi:hypothetical protein
MEIALHQNIFADVVKKFSVISNGIAERPEMEDN